VNSLSYTLHAALSEIVLTSFFFFIPFLWEMHTVHHSVFVQSQVTKIFKLASLILFILHYFDT